MERLPAPFTAEQRRSARRSLEVPIRMSVTGGVVRGTTDNVSGVGLMFFAEEPLRVQVEFEDADGIVRLHTGRLVRTQKITASTTGYAIEFDPE
jgi:hypothetical protein